MLDHVNFPKVVTVLAIVFGIALGACGVTVAAANTIRQSGSFFGVLVIVESGVMVLSAVGLVVTTIVWVVASAMGKRGDTDGPQKLFDDVDKGGPGAGSI